MSLGISSGWGSVTRVLLYGRVTLFTSHRPPAGDEVDGDYVLVLGVVHGRPCLPAAPDGLHRDPGDQVGGQAAEPGGDVERALQLGAVARGDVGQLRDPRLPVQQRYVHAQKRGRRGLGLLLARRGRGRGGLDLLRHPGGERDYLGRRRGAEREREADRVGAIAQQAGELARAGPGQRHELQRAGLRCGADLRAGVGDRGRRRVGEL